MQAIAGLVVLQLHDATARYDLEIFRVRLVGDGRRRYKDGQDAETPHHEFRTLPSVVDCAQWEDVQADIEGDELRLGFFCLRYGLPHWRGSSNAGPRAACYFAR